MNFQICQELFRIFLKTDKIYFHFLSYKKAIVNKLNIWYNIADTYCTKERGFYFYDKY